jgi:SAM-dependent methyltransferase
VAAVDLNPEMLAVARSLSASGAEIGWYETTAESTPFRDAEFDVVFCQLGLQFIGDKLTALREMRRVLVPGGRILVSTPTPNAFFDVLDEALARHVSAEAAGFVRTVFSCHDPAMLERLFREAGFEDVTVRTDAKQLRLPAARDFLWQYLHSTPLAAALSKLDRSRLAALESDVVSRWQRWSDGAGMTSEQRLNVAKARR